MAEPKRFPGWKCTSKGNAKIYTHPFIERAVVARKVHSHANIHRVTYNGLPYSTLESAIKAAEMDIQPYMIDSPVIDVEIMPKEIVERIQLTVGVKESINSTQEQQILEHLSKAWDTFYEIPEHESGERAEFRGLIRRARDMIHARIGRRSIDA